MNTAVTDDKVTLIEIILSMSLSMGALFSKILCDKRVNSSICDFIYINVVFTINTKGCSQEKLKDVYKVKQIINTLYVLMVFK